jgi:hypothetical protein
VASSELMKYPDTHSTIVHLPEAPPAAETDDLLTHHDGDNEIAARAHSLLKGTVLAIEDTDDPSRSLYASTTEEDSLSEQPPTTSKPDFRMNRRVRSKGNFVAATAKTAANAVTSTAVQAASTVATTATSAANQAANLLQSHDGEYDDAAFVVFSRLSAVHSSIQM